MKAKRIVGIVLAVILTITLLPLAQGAVYADQTEPIEYEAPSPGSISEAMSKFVDALSKFTKDTSDLKKIPAVLERFGGITSAISGGIAVLQMCGLLTDSTSKALDNILTEVHNVEDELHSMDVKLDEIIQELNKIELELKENDLAKKTTDYQTQWTTFNTNYVEPLHDFTSEYDGFITRALRAWWDEGTHKGERVLYTEYEGEIVATYSTAPYEDGFPEKSGNDETVLLDYSFGIPSEYMPNTVSGLYNPDTFSDDFIALAKDAILSAANAHTLEATEAFYQTWDALDDAGKTEKANAYAQDLLNTVVNRVSCETITQNDDWVIKFKNAYLNYCSNMTSPTSGVSSLVKLHCVTNPLQGIAALKYIDACNRMKAGCGSYGIFLLSVLGQDANQKTSAKNEVQQAWVDTILGIDQIRDNVLTRYGNYCYLTDSLIRLRKLTISSTMTANYKQWTNWGNKYYARFNKFSSTPWQILDEDNKDASKMPIMSTVNATLLHQMIPVKDPYWVSDILVMNGVSIYPFFDWIMTSHKKPDVFSLSDHPELECECLWGHQDYFETGKTYEINQGNDPDVVGTDFVLHDSISADFININTAEQYTDQFAVARAAYKEHHWRWCVDEGHFFFRNVNFSHTTKGGVNVQKDFSMSREVFVLEEVPLPNGSIPDGSLLEEIAAIPRAKHEPEPEPYSTADWNTFAANLIDTYTEGDSKLQNGIDTVIEEAEERSASDGNAVSLTEEEKTTLAAAMKTKLFDMQNELQSNSALVYRDVFGINGDESAELALAAAVLPGTYLDENGASRITAENMDTVAEYEAGVRLSFESKNGRITALLNPAMNIHPELVIWDPAIEEFLTFEIPNEVMTAQGLTMNVRVSAVSADNRNSVKIRHYDNDLDMNLLEESNAAIQGKGTDRYAELSVKQCSPFELDIPIALKLREQTKPVTPAKTGDSNSIGLWIALIAISALCIGIVLFVRRRFTRH